MNELAQPIVTHLALDLLEAHDTVLNRAARFLLLSIDGRRNTVQLESVARALGLREDALESLRAAGLIEVFVVGAGRTLQ